MNSFNANLETKLAKFVPVNRKVTTPIVGKTGNQSIDLQLRKLRISRLFLTKNGIFVKDSGRKKKRT